MESTSSQNKYSSSAHQNAAMSSFVVPLVTAKQHEAESILSSKALNDLGVDYHMSGNIAGAMKCYDCAIRMEFERRTRNPKNYQPMCDSGKRQIDMPDPLPEASSHDSSLIGMGRFVTPLKTSFHQDNKWTSNNDPSTATMLYNISLLKMSESQFTTAKDLLEVALKDLDRNADEEDFDEETPLFARLRLMILTNLGMALYRLGHFDEAADRFEDASALPVLLLQDAQQSRDHSSHSPRYANMLLRSLVFSLLNCARALDAAGGHRSLEAIGMVRDAGGLCETIESCFENSVSKAGSERRSETDRADLLSGAAYIEATIYHTRGQHELAEESYRQCIAQSSSRRLHRQSLSEEVLLAAALCGLGRSLFERRRLSASIAPLRASWSLRSLYLGEEHVDSIDSLYALGRSLHDLEEMVDALAVYERVYRLQCRSVGPGHVDALRTVCNVARIQRTCGNGAEALAACDAAIEGGRLSLGESHPFVLDMYAMRGMVLHELGRTEEASAVFKYLIRLSDRLGNPKFEDHLAKCLGGPCLLADRTPGAAAA